MTEATEKELAAAVDRMGDKIALAVKDMPLEMAALRQDMIEQMTSLRQDMIEQFGKMDVRLAKVETRLNWMIASVAGAGSLLGGALVAWLRSQGLV